MAAHLLDKLNTKFTTDEFLGSKVEDHQLVVSLWSPTATEINLLLYDKNAESLLGKKALKKKENGVWIGQWKEEEFNIKNFDALFYQYEVTANGQTHLALDPYAKSMAAYNPHSKDKVGKAAIVNLDVSKVTHVELKNEADFVGYEAHIHDFTIDPNLEIENSKKGTYPGFAKIIPHLKDLGITHVQFMPLQMFATVNELDRTFQSADVEKNKINYNWGYDPLNYFTPSGWYSLNPQDPYQRTRDVRKIISTLHQNGIGVILDVVYNHLYTESILENIAPGCYLRKNSSGEISHGTGAGATLESRNLMARRLIIDSLKHWQNYYGVDGFRFDLMGFIDQETMKEIRKALGDKAILYGEAWNFTDLPFEEATTKTNFPHQLNLSVFNDSSRDAYAGRMEGKGFAQGIFTEAPKVKTGIIGAIKEYPSVDGDILDNEYDRFALQPAETLNYLSIHDGFTLWDKINLSNGKDQKERESLVKFAYGMLFTSQGKIVIHGGDEFGRSKPLVANDPNPTRAHTSDVVDPENGVSYFHENSYKSPDPTNMINWKRGEAFFDLKNYVKGLIELRRNTQGLRFNQASSVIKGLHFINDPKLPGVIAYLINNKLENPHETYKNILVLHNAHDEQVSFKVSKIKNLLDWKILVDNQRAGIVPIKETEVEVYNGEIKIPRKSTVVLGEL